MLELTRGLAPEDWQWFGKVLGFMILGAMVVLRGVKKEPPELGVKPPPSDMNLYLLADVRSQNRKLEELSDRLDYFHDQNGREIEALRRDVAMVYRDTQVIRDRGRRE